MASLDKFAAQTVEYAVGFAAGFALGRALTPAATEIEQTAYSGHPNLALDPKTVASLQAKGLDVPGGADREASAHGIGSTRLGALKTDAFTHPGLPELLMLWRRGDITDGELTEGLRRNSFDPTWDGHLAALKVLRLDPAVIATAIQRGIMEDPGFLPVAPPEGEGKVRAFPRSRLPTLKEAEASGIDYDRLFVETAIVGLPPAPGELLQLVNRGVIEDVDFFRGVAEGNTRNEWGEVLLQLKRRLLDPHQYAEAELRGVKSHAEGEAGAALSGMEPADYATLFDILGRPLNIHAIVTALARGGEFGGTYDDVPEPYRDAIRRSAIRPEYARLDYANRYRYPSDFVTRALAKDGTITAAELEDVFLRTGMEPGFAKLVAEHTAKTAAPAKQTHVAKAETQLWATIHKSYLAGESSDAQATDALAVLGVPVDEEPKVMALWQHEREIIRRTLTPSQIKKAWKETKMTRDEALARLERLGMNAADAGVLLDE